VSGAAPGARVLINARDAARPELGGVERWTRELVAGLYAGARAFVWPEIEALLGVAPRS
jgi:hypothetical protein